MTTYLWQKLLVLSPLIHLDGEWWGMVKAVSLFSLWIKGSWWITMFDWKRSNDPCFYLFICLLFIALCIPVVLPGARATMDRVRPLTSSRGRRERKAVWSQLIHDSQLWRARGIFFRSPKPAPHQRYQSQRLASKLSTMSHFFLFFLNFNLMFIFELFDQRVRS